MSGMLLALAATGLAFATETIRLDVDASHAQQKIEHTVETIPVSAGPLTLAYAHWIPGEHAPDGPIDCLAGLHIYAGSQELPWRRDLTDLYAFHLDVPSDAHELTVKFDYLSPLAGGNFGASVSMNENLAVINWYENLLYPRGVSPDDLTYVTTLHLPKGWKHGGSLEVDHEDGDTVHYKPTTLTLLADHPVNMGRHFKSVLLWPASPSMPEHAIDIVADDDWALDIPQGRIDAYKRLPVEARAIMGGHSHYAKYHWLMTLSDHLGSFGVEHWECSDDRDAENFMHDDNVSAGFAELLPHEFFHSWNGKTRRPAGLVNGGFDNPMQGDLLWVYEGLTDYYGQVLAARTGLLTPEQYRATLADDIYAVDVPGRTWRNLQDTADAAPYLYFSGPGWNSYKRGTDFYAEGNLLWLSVDVKIRQLTHNQKSLDDFCAIFHGQGGDGKPFLKPYREDEVFDTLNQVAPFDWKSYINAMLLSKSRALPLDGIEGCGWKYTYTDTPDYRIGNFAPVPSLGLTLGTDGAVNHVELDGPAFKAGFGYGMKVIAVDGQAFDVGNYKRSINEAVSGHRSLQFIVMDGATYKVLELRPTGGFGFPTLSKESGKEDLLSAIIAPRVKS